MTFLRSYLKTLNAAPPDTTSRRTNLVGGVRRGIRQGGHIAYMGLGRALGRGLGKCKGLQKGLGRGTWSGA